MTDPLQLILQSGNKPSNHFPVTSRYYSIGTATIEAANGDPVVFLQRRIIPSSENLELIREHTVKEDDRLDNIAATYIGDPAQSWQIADANDAMKPEELTNEVGSKIRISQPQGIRSF